MTLPDQHPTRRHVALRPRTDRYHVSPFPVRERRAYVEPVEHYDPDGEARPLDWHELLTPQNLAGGVLMFVGVVGFVIFAGIVW